MIIKSARSSSSSVVGQHRQGEKNPHRLNYDHKEQKTLFPSSKQQKRLMISTDAEEENPPFPSQSSSFSTCCLCPIESRSAPFFFFLFGKCLNERTFLLGSRSIDFFFSLRARMGEEKKEGGKREKRKGSKEQKKSRGETGGKKRGRKKKREQKPIDLSK